MEPPTPGPPRLQDLPRRWARFCLGIEHFAAMDLGRDFTRVGCLVACSGGADSTALLLIAALLCRKNGGRVAAAHLDHGLRSEAEADAAFVSAICEKWNIPLVAEHADVAELARRRGCGLEEAGRNARYSLYARAREKFGALTVLVAHQLNDLAEDQLMRLTRGAGWPALGGMPAVDDARGLVRPLLLTPRADIEAFLAACGQTWRTDASNYAPFALRNRVRGGILPALVRENTGYLDAARRLWRQARLDGAHFEALLAPLLPQGDATGILLPAATLNTLDAALRPRLFKAALDRLGPGQALADGLFRLDGLWTGRAFGRRVRFPGDKEAVVVKAGVRMQPIDRKKLSG